jgi:hypothetical protein
MATYSPDYNTHGGHFRFVFTATGAHLITAPVNTYVIPPFVPGMASNDQSGADRLASFYAAGAHPFFLDLYNNSGGAVAVAFDAIYHHTGYTDPAPFMRRTTTFFWDLVGGIWVQAGGWSGDIA